MWQYLKQLVLEPEEENAGLEGVGEKAPDKTKCQTSGGQLTRQDRHVYGVPTHSHTKRETRLVPL